jgi:hypothetical protein
VSGCSNERPTNAGLCFLKRLLKAPRGESGYFNRFSDPIREQIDARVWAGIHYRTADVQAAVLGKRSPATCERRHPADDGSTIGARSRL